MKEISLKIHYDSYIAIMVTIYFMPLDEPYRIEHAPLYMSTYINIIIEEALLVNRLKCRKYNYCDVIICMHDGMSLPPSLPP